MFFIGYFGLGMETNFKGCNVANGFLKTVGRGGQQQKRCGVRFLRWYCHFLNPRSAIHRVPVGTRSRAGSSVRSLANNIDRFKVRRGFHFEYPSIEGRSALNFYERKTIVRAAKDGAHRGRRKLNLAAHNVAGRDDGRPTRAGSKIQTALQTKTAGRMGHDKFTLIATDSNFKSPPTSSLPDFDTGRNICCQENTS
jgi:hypothetical protein